MTPPTEQASGRRSDARVLVVEDEPLTRALLCRLLKEEPGVETVQAENGLEALEVLTSERIDLVVSAIGMPVLDGIGMLASMRKHALCAGIPVVILSSGDAESKIAQATSLGVWDYIVKPIDRERVAPRLRLALEHAARKRGVAPAVRSRVLVADSDPDFLAFAGSALEALSDVETARTAAETVAKVLSLRPNVALVSENLPSGTLSFLSAKAQELGLRERMRLCLLCGERDGAGELETEASVVLRTLDAETFSDQIMRLLAGGRARSAEVFLGADRLGDVLSRAARVLLGMTGGEDPVELEAPAAESELNLFSQSRLRAREHGSIYLTVGCSLGFADELRNAPRNAQGPDPTAAERRKALDELVTTLSSTLVAYCSQQCHTVVASPAGPVPGPPKIDPATVRDLRFDLSWRNTGPLTLFCRLLGKL